MNSIGYRSYTSLGASIFILALVVGANPVLGQGGQPNIPTFPTTPTPTPTPQVGQGGQQFGGGGGGQQTSQTQGGNQGPVDIDPGNAVNLAQIPDIRNQGFIGATASRIIELGFVGAASDLSGPGLSEGATFGGGVNSGVGGGGGGGRAAAGRGGAAQRGGMGLGMGQAGSQNFFEVTRGGLRGAIQPNFTSPVVTGDRVVNQFATNFSRLPNSQAFDGQYQVSVNDRTATVSGWVTSQADANRLISQLRFQPGIYSIDNQLEIRQR